MNKLLTTAIGSLLLIGGNAQADFVINDDLIVDGSACVGFDCTNGLSFGFDTIVLKENNLRIFFDDTSSASSFPRNDWRLVANDSANGGASKFSIEDVSGGRTPFTVEANAPSHSLYVDDGGRLGIRTSTPSTEVHIVDGDTPTLRLEQNGSSGFTPQTWDVAGNETNFFIRDVTNGSTLPFRIKPGAPTSSIFIQDDGDVQISNNLGVGTASPGFPLHVVRNGFVTYRLENTDSGVKWDQTNSGSGNFRFNSDDGDGFEFDLNQDGDLEITGTLTVAGGTLPDYVFKDNYELMTLKELEAFIESNQHLPGVPSAKEIAETGKMNMTEMQIKLLEKVEELTLYTLEQENTIARLNHRLNNLESK